MYANFVINLEIKTFLKNENEGESIGKKQHRPRNLFKNHKKTNKNYILCSEFSISQTIASFDDQYTKHVTV